MVVVGGKRANSCTKTLSELISIVSRCEGEKVVKMMMGSNLGTNSWEKFTEEKRGSNFLVCMLKITVTHLDTSLLHT